MSQPKHYQVAGLTWTVVIQDPNNIHYSAQLQEYFIFISSNPLAWSCNVSVPTPDGIGGQGFPVKVPSHLKAASEVLTHCVGKVKEHLSISEMN